MLRRPWRSVPSALLCTALLVPTLAACGSENDAADSSTSSESSSESADSADGAAGGEATGESIEGVTFTGDVGDSLTAEWSAAVEAPSETETYTLVEGDGDAIDDGDTVNAYLYLGDGTAQSDLYSDYDQGAAQAVPVDPSSGEVLYSLMSGATYGSRVAAVTTADILFGGSADGNALGLDGDAPVVVVADLGSAQEASPTPSSDQVEDADPSTQPTVVEEGGDPVGLDFSGLDEPALDTPVQRVILSEGDGAELSADSTVTVNYLGSVYDADAPFDESYSRGEPLESPLSGLIQGWAIGLDGVKVGSRVLLQIPPAYGYGAAGSGSAIPGNATLWFLIDVVDAQ